MDEDSDSDEVVAVAPPKAKHGLKQAGKVQAKAPPKPVSSDS